MAREVCYSASLSGAAPHRRVLLDALKVHVEQKHEEVANLWTTRLKNQKERESWRRTYLAKYSPRAHLFKEQRVAKL
jgi:hypothetical protein